MITDKDIIDNIYALLPDRPLYKNAFPDDSDDDYFLVINTLGVPADPIQSIEININVYAKDADINRGIPDLTTLNTGGKSVINTLHNYTEKGMDIMLIMVSTLREQEINCHFTNLRFRVVITSN